MTESSSRNTMVTQGADDVSTKRARIAVLAKNDPTLVFTSLHHYIDLNWLRAAYRATKKDAAVGVDGQSMRDYGEGLDSRLRDLLSRIRSGRYRAPPVRRVHIPKGDRNSTRPIGIPTIEDKIVQRAVVMLLEPVYESVFVNSSFGFRRGRSAHQALRALRSSIMETGIRWILDVDVRAYFDTIDHGKLRSFLDERVTDGVIRRMIDKWLKAGVLEEGRVTRSNRGTPQGGVISPLLANIFLHYVLDTWLEYDVARHMRANCSFVRFADDFVLCFANRTDCQRVLEVLPKRLSKYGLTMHPEKTKMVDFRFKRHSLGRNMLSYPTTFDFLGFTHVWGKSRRGKNIVFQITAKDRFARAVKRIRQVCKMGRHDPIPEQHAKLSRIVRGHYAYYGITGNSKRIRWFLRQVLRAWFYWLGRRTRGLTGIWKRYEHLVKQYPLPPAKIVHRYA